MSIITKNIERLENFPKQGNFSFIIYKGYPCYVTDTGEVWNIGERREIFSGSVTNAILSYHGVESLRLRHEKVRLKKIEVSLTNSNSATLEIRENGVEVKSYSLGNNTNIVIDTNLGITPGASISVYVSGTVSNCICTLVFDVLA